MTQFCGRVDTEFISGPQVFDRAIGAVRGHLDKLMVLYDGRVIGGRLHDLVYETLWAHGFHWTEMDLAEGEGPPFARDALGPSTLAGGEDPSGGSRVVARGIDIYQRYRLDGILAVGGARTLQCAQAIAAAGRFGRRGEGGEPALPLFAVFTLASSGREGALPGFAPVGSPGPLPRLLALDPVFAYTGDRGQVAEEIAGLFCRGLELYLAPGEGAYLQRRLAEGILKTCIHCAGGALRGEEGDCGDLLWALGLAVSELPGWGRKLPWEVHGMGRQLCDRFDAPWGAVLSVLAPAWMGYVLRATTLEKFAEYGVQVWRLNRELPKEELARRAIDETQRFFTQVLGLPERLGELGVTGGQLGELAERAANPALQEGVVPLDAADVLEIYRACL